MMSSSRSWQRRNWPPLSGRALVRSRCHRRSGWTGVLLPVRAILRVGDGLPR